jgi:hypothetical protein
VRDRRAVGAIEARLAVEPRPAEVFDPAAIEDLPEPARRYLRHAIEPGTPLARSVRLKLDGRMKPRPDAGYMELTADELIAAHRGFLWRARLRAGPVPIRVVDHYAGDDGAVRIAALGLIPMGSSTGPDVTRSSRGRLAAETVWLPSALLPGPRVAWRAVDDEHATVALTVDGDTVDLTLAVDPEGRLREVTMQRHGDVDPPGWKALPYGFAVEEERAFGGYTVPSKLRGGWWYGTERYDPDDASQFEVLAAEYR